MKDGITLIALVITIIVLILLAMISISALTGPNGLIGKSLDAKIANDKGEIYDRAQTEVIASVEENGEINWEKLKENLAKNFHISEESIIEKKEGDKIKGLTFTVEKNKRNYRVNIDEDGNVTVTYGGENTGTTKMLKPGDKATKTQKDNYEDESGKKATIPQGFKVSSEDHEIDTGLVVEAPDGSEFVWIPVEKAIAENEASGGTTKSMAVKDPTDENNYRGILYDFSGTSSSVMTGCTTNNFENNTSYREPAYLTSNNGDANSANVGRVTLERLKAEYKAMIENVAKYGGFYVGRYETSINGKTVQSKKNQTAMDSSVGSGNTWWGLYEKQKNYASSNGINSVVGSTMIWGSQYDAILNWVLTGKDASKVTASSIQHPKTKTGITEDDVMNNIYDLGNNLCEWSLEADGTEKRVGRGADYEFNVPPSNRWGNSPTTSLGQGGSRVTLYIL